MQGVGPKGGDKEAKLHNQVEQPTSSSSNFRCVAEGEYVLSSARPGNWRACTCSPLTAAHLPCDRLVGAQCRYFDRQYRQRRRQGRRHLPRHRQLFLDDFVLFSRLCGSADGGYEAASRAACSVTTTTLAALAARQLSLAFRQLGRPARASPAALRALCRQPTAHALRFVAPEKNVRI